MYLKKLTKIPFDVDTLPKLHLVVSFLVANG